MRVQFDPEFYKLYKKADVRIRNAVDKKIELFTKDPYNPELNNHQLLDEYEGFSSIDITNDYRAMYEEVQGANETVAYFSLLGTHKELYK
jgi:addiction module RelE/StbE family toxin